MSELKEVLSPAQLIKHYELLQYLAKHPNQELTLAQLDYILPRGASIQRFPEEWFDLMEQGECSNRNVELSRHSRSSAADKEEESRDQNGAPLSAMEAALRRRAKVTLLCRQPEVRTLAELRTLLQCPSTQPDAEGCVALHTDQIIVAPSLLRRAQRGGLAYYFPDRYGRNEVEVNIGKRVNSSVRTPNSFSGAGIVDAGGAQDALSAAQAAASTTHTFLALPPGIRLRHRHFTIRGVASQDEHCLPVRLIVGERVLVTVDNTIALAQRRGSQLEVKCSLAGIKISEEGKMDSSLSGGGQQQPLRIRSSTAELPPRSVTPAGASEPVTVRPRQLRMDLEAVAKGTFKLILTVNGCECMVDMRVLEEPVGTPGVLIGREQLPSSFAVPSALLLADPLVCPELQQAVEAEGEWKRARVEEEKMEATTPSSTRESAATVEEERALRDPLPWWQNTSPLCAAVRDVAYPAESVVAAATAAVFSQRSLTHEMEMRLVRQQYARERERLEAASGRSRRRRRNRGHQDLRNRHLLHFGLDLSVPFVRKTQR